MRRSFKWIVVVILLAVIVLPNVARWRRAERSRLAAEEESFAVLTHARTPEELQEAVGHLGVILKIRDGGWIAVRYHDSHATPGWSSAVAHDSGGKWFVSGEHFCGRFRIHRQLRERGEQGDPEFCAVEESASLEAARERLVELGFRSVSPPANP